MRVPPLLVIALILALAAAHLGLVRQIPAHLAVGWVALPLGAGLIVALALHLGLLGFVARRIRKR